MGANNGHHAVTAATIKQRRLLVHDLRNSRVLRAGTGVGAEVFVEFPGFAFVLVGVFGDFADAGDVGPFLGIFAVELDPALGAIVSVGAAGGGIIARGEFELDLGAKVVRRAGREAHLGPTEFRPLHRLMLQPGRVYSRAQLLEAVWEHNLEAGERAVDQSIRRLREALNAPGQPDLIRTVRAEGYAQRID